jgi:hypothetical protein
MRRRRLISHSAKVRELALGTLMVCPVCGVLLSRSSRECFVCSWHGRFSGDQDSVQAGLGQILAACPDLDGVFLT